MTEEMPETEPIEQVEPSQPPAPLTTIAHIEFNDPEGIIEAGPYAASIARPAGMTDADYAKAIAETVERTVLLQLGALPILQKVEA